MGLVVDRVGAPFTNIASPVVLDVLGEMGTMTSLHRCDKCSARAYTRIIHVVTGHSLQFCGHHFHKAPAATIESGSWIVWDDRYLLEARGSSEDKAEDQ
jgi:recombinational DNA repair protein (RecF pathway)